MKLQNISNSMHFQKTLKADCKVLNSSTKEPVNCKIWELDKEEDKDYFKNLEKDQNWQDAIFLKNQVEDFDKWLSETDRHYYTIEDENEKCLGYTLTENEDDECKIIFLETATSFKNDIPKERGKRYKYIGETLLSFVAKKTQEAGGKEISLRSMPTAISFYEEKCGFKRKRLILEVPSLPHFEMVLDKSKFDSLINQNETHTTSKINIKC